MRGWVSSGESEFTCPKCMRKIHAYIPKGGDGSLVYLRPHKDQTGPDGVPCPGSKRTMPLGMR